MVKSIETHKRFFATRPISRLAIRLAVAEGRRVTSYATHDAKEIAKLLEMVGGLLIRRRELSRFWAMPSEFRVKNVHAAVDFVSKMCYTMW
jgi:hypothetical protein